MNAQLHTAQKPEPMWGKQWHGARSCCRVGGGNLGTGCIRLLTDCALTVDDTAQKAVPV
jgi:hypothetical protein